MPSLSAYDCNPGEEEQLAEWLAEQEYIQQEEAREQDAQSQPLPTDEEDF